VSSTQAREAGYVQLRDRWAALVVDLPGRRFAPADSLPQDRAVRASESELGRLLESFAELPQTVVERIETLSAMLRGDAEDADVVSLGSVRGLCRFLVSHAVAVPEVVADGDGQLIAEWLDDRAGRLSMRFRPDGRAEFALAGGEEAGSPSRVRLCGAEEPGKAARSVRAVTGRFPFL